jgi:hypothetical protein
MFFYLSFFSKETTFLENELCSKEYDIAFLKPLLFWQCGILNNLNDSLNENNENDG